MGEGEGGAAVHREYAVLLAMLNYAVRLDMVGRTPCRGINLPDMLGEHLAVKGVGRADAEALLFTSPNGGVLRYSNWVRRCWYPSAVATGVGHMVKDAETGRTRYDGIGFHDLRRANATGLLAEGIDVKTAQTMLGHSESRLTLDLYAKAVAAMGEAAAAAMGARFLGAPRDERAMESGSGAAGQ